MPDRRYKLFYDEDDYRLLKMIRRIVSDGKNPLVLRRLFDADLHPRGIKELAAPRSVYCPVDSASASTSWALSSREPPRTGSPRSGPSRERSSTTPA